MVYKSSGLASSGIHIDYKTTDYLYRETENERMAAQTIARRIMEEYEIDMDAIFQELHHVNKSDPYGPGEVIALDFLHEMVAHAV
jgi:hypothetical protein